MRRRSSHVGFRLASRAWWLVLLSPGLSLADDETPIATSEESVEKPAEGTPPVADPPVSQDPCASPHCYRRGMIPTGLFLSGGVSAAITGHSTAGTSATLGGEVSVVHFEGIWYGAYADARYDLAAAEGRVSVGPEVGFAFLGLDAGVYRRIGPGADQWGLQVRPMISAAIFTLYGAYGSTIGATTTNFYEGGILLKFPLQILDTQKRESNAVSRTPASVVVKSETKGL